MVPERVLSGYPGRDSVNSNFIWVRLVNSQNEGTLFLMDTGATISLIPAKLFHEIHPDDRPKLFPSPFPITASNGSELGCDGVATLTVEIDNTKFTHRFYVCQNVVLPILGFDFQQRFDLYARPAKQCVMLKDREIPAYDQTGYLLKSKISLEEATTLLPNEEAILTGRVHNKTSQNGKVLAIQSASTTYAHTGAMVCHIVTRPSNGRVPLRVLNLNDHPIKLYKGSIMGIAEPVVSVNKWSQVDNDPTPTSPAELPAPKTRLNTTYDPSLEVDSPIKTDSISPHPESPTSALTQSQTESPQTDSAQFQSPPTIILESHLVKTPTPVHRTLTIQEQLVNRVETALNCDCSCKCDVVHVNHLDGSETAYCNRTDVSFDSSAPLQLCCHKLYNMSNQQRYEVLSAQSPKGPSSPVPSHVRELYEQSLPRLETEELRTRVAHLLTQYQDVFAKHPDDIGRAKLIKHDIDTGDAQPVRQRCRRFAKVHIEAIQEHVKKLSEAGIIRPSESEWASNIVVVKKKDGTWRMCIDYRELNTKTRNPDSYLLPRIDDTLDALADAKVFCTLDMLQGYHQVELTERAKEKTAFHAPHCSPTHWEYNYMPFGLVRAPRTFQRLMDKVIQGLEYKIALCYLDDIIIFASTKLACIDNIEQVLIRLRAANLKLKAKKCVLFAESVSYLGHLITKDGVHTDPAKIESIKNRHPPRTVRQVRSFLGLANYYYRFIKDYAQIAAPLNNLTKKGTKFRWTEVEQKSFDEIKHRLITAPIMAYPRSKGMFILDTDASDRTVGAVLSQVQVDNDVAQEKVIAYYSYNFKQTERNYCARQREMLAIVQSVKHFDVYLRGPKFLIRTDHASLRYIKTLKEMPGQFARWIMYLEEFSYTIEVRKGTLHGNADGVSRGCSGKKCICADLEEWERRRNIRRGTKLAGLTDVVISDDTPLDDDLVMSYRCSDGKHLDTNECVINALKLKPHYSNAEIAKLQQSDPDIGPVYVSKKSDPVTRPTWNKHSAKSPATKAYLADWLRLEFHNDVLYRRWESNDGLRSHLQFLVPRLIQKEMLTKVHDSQTRAHMGRRRTMYALQQFCYWYKMFDDVVFWLATCQICQKRKQLVPKPKAPMQIYKTGAPYERISMDVCGPLVLTPRGNQYLLVISDHFTKYTRAFPMKDQTAATVAHILIYEWFAIHGEPMQIHSDQGSNFESKLMQDLCASYGIEKTRTTPFHPQADGQVERFNKTVMNLIYSIIDKKLDTWDLKCIHAVSAYNASVHESTGFTPNRMVFADEIKHSDARILPTPIDNDMSYAEYVQKQRELKAEAFDAARESIGRKALLQKKHYDRTSNLLKYKIGDPIWILNSSKPEKGTKKLISKFNGPYWIVDVLSDVNFRFAEHATSKMRVIHHDRIKPYKSREPLPTPAWVFERSKTKFKTTETPTQPIPTNTRLTPHHLAIPDIIITPPDAPHQKEQIFPDVLLPPPTPDAVILPSQKKNDAAREKIRKRKRSASESPYKRFRRSKSDPTNTRADKIKRAKKLLQKAAQKKTSQHSPQIEREPSTNDSNHKSNSRKRSRSPKEKPPDTPPKITRRGRAIKRPSRFDS